MAEFERGRKVRSFCFAGSDMSVCPDHAEIVLESGEMAPSIWIKYKQRGGSAIQMGNTKHMAWIRFVDEWPV